MDIFNKRPFKTINADKFDLEEVIKMFVNPLDALGDPFSFESSIIKGEMGTGKTMYLRANHAIYDYQLLQSMINGEPLIIPIYIKLSDFSDSKDPRTIYQNIIKKLISELSKMYKKFADKENFANIHKGIVNLPSTYFNYGVLSKIEEKVRKLDVEQYKEKILKQLDTKCGLEHQLIKASASYHNEKLVEITERKDVSFADLEKAYEWILREGTDRILFLFDEAGSLSTKFFNEEGDSYFEILMNQLRTLKESEIKIAVYPHTASDKLKNVKFGQPIVLKENIYNIDGYKKFRNKVIELVDRYLENYSINCKLHANNIFEMHESNEFGDSIEQLIFGSNGVMRYFVYYADIAMKICDSKNKSKIDKQDAIAALTEAGNETKGRYGDRDQEFLDNIEKRLRANKGTFKFRYLYKSLQLQKFIDKNNNQSIIRTVDSSSKKKGTVYSLDYAYCVSQNIATHYEKNSQKIDRERSYLTGEWISRLVTIKDNKDDIFEADVILIGTINFLLEDKTYVICENGEKYLLLKDNILNIEKGLKIGKQIEFTPLEIDGVKYCSHAKIL